MADIGGENCSVALRGATSALVNPVDEKSFQLSVCRFVLRACKQ